MRNLIDEDVFKFLLFQPSLNEQNIQVFGGNGGPLDIKGFAIHPVTIGDTLPWHEFAVVRKLSLKVLSGASVLQPHLCYLYYLNNKHKELKFGVQNCFKCNYNRALPFDGTAVQMRYVDRALHHSINNVQIDNNFIVEIPDVTWSVNALLAAEYFTLIPGDYESHVTKQHQQMEFAPSKLILFHDEIPTGKIITPEIDPSVTIET